MATQRVSGSKRASLPDKVAKKASTVIDVGDVLISTSGQADVAVQASVKLLGIAMKKITAADDDYASTTPVTIESIDANAIYKMLVVTGTPAASMIGLFYSLADETGVDLTEQTYDQVQVVGLISSTEVLVKFNPVVL